MTSPFLVSLVMQGTQLGWLIAHCLKDYRGNDIGILTRSEFSGLKKREKNQKQNSLFTEGNIQINSRESNLQKVRPQIVKIMFPCFAPQIFLDWGKALQRAQVPSGEAWGLAGRLPPLDKSLTNSCLEDPGKRPHFPSKGSQDHFKVSSKSQLLLIRPLFG